MRAFGVGAMKVTRAGGQLRHEPSAGPNPVNTRIMLIALAIGSLVAVHHSTRQRTSVASTTAPIRRLPPAVLLLTGASGTLGAQTFTVSGQALLEVGRVRERQERREYELVGSRNERALLVDGLNDGAEEWHLLTPVQPSGAMAWYLRTKQPRSGKAARCHRRTDTARDRLVLGPSGRRGRAEHHSGGQVRLHCPQRERVAGGAMDGDLARTSCRQITENDVRAAFTLGAR